jgi:hypothetical protein
MHAKSTCSTSCRQQQAGRHPTHVSHQHMQHILQAAADTQANNHHAAHQHTEHILQATTGRLTPHMQPISKCSTTCRQWQATAGMDAGSKPRYAAHQHMQHDLQAMTGRQRPTTGRQQQAGRSLPCIPADISTSACKSRPAHHAFPQRTQQQHPTPVLCCGTDGVRMHADAVCTIHGFASTASTGWSEISPVVAQGWRGSPWP